MIKAQSWRHSIRVRTNPLKLFQHILVYELWSCLYSVINRIASYTVSIGTYIIAILHKWMTYHLYKHWDIYIYIIICEWEWCERMGSFHTPVRTIYELQIKDQQKYIFKIVYVYIRYGISSITDKIFRLLLLISTMDNNIKSNSIRWVALYKVYCQQTSRQYTLNGC